MNNLYLIIMFIFKLINSLKIWFGIVVPGARTSMIIFIILGPGRDTHLSKDCTHSRFTQRAHPPSVSFSCL